MHVCVIFLYFGVKVVGEGYFCNVLLISLIIQQPPCSNQCGKSRIMIGLLSKKYYYVMFLFIIHFCYIWSFVCKIYNSRPFQQQKSRLFCHYHQLQQPNRRRLYQSHKNSMFHLFPFTDMSPRLGISVKGSKWSYHASEYQSRVRFLSDCDYTKSKERVFLHLGQPYIRSRKSMSLFLIRTYRVHVFVFLSIRIYLSLLRRSDKNVISQKRSDGYDSTCASSLRKSCLCVKASIRPF